MKFLHTGDLHIGKVVNGFSMLKDQEFILNQIIATAQSEEVDGIFLAGDIYDRSIPTKEAVCLLDEFLTRLVAIGKEVYLISGNHDSPERIDFAHNILEKKGIHISGILKKEVKEIVKEDSYGTVHIYLLPFATSKVMKYVLEQEDLDCTYHCCMEQFIKQMKINPSKRNILVTHHFVIGNGETPIVSDSEVKNLVGGVEQVDGVIFSEFDYVALGHLHKAQKVGRKTIRYAGSPIKYSFSEVNHEKTMTIVELKEKGQVIIKEIPLIPLHDMRVLKGKLSNLIQKEVVEEGNREDFVQVILTDKEELFEPMEQLRAVYPNIMQLVIEKNIKEESQVTFSSIHLTKRTTKELFEQFYEMVTGEDLKEQQVEFVEQLIDEITCIK